MSTKLFPITFTILSDFNFISTSLTPAFSIMRALFFEIFCPASARISPVIGLIISSALISPSILLETPNFLLYLYLPTLAKSYLFSSKNRLLKSVVALSIVGGSPGRKRL